MRITKPWIIVAVTVAVLLGGWFLAYRRTQQLKSEVEKVEKLASDALSGARRLQENIVQTRTGGSLLYRMALSGTYNDVFEFIHPIPPESLGTEVVELEEFPSARLVLFSRSLFNPDDKIIAREDYRSILVLVKPETLEVMSYVLHRGAIDSTTIALDRSTAPPRYTLKGESLDFNEVQYKIQSTMIRRLD